jgi:hypothetical protein
MPEACAGTIVWDDEAREPREPRAETPVNAAKFTMVRDCARRRFRDALIGTFKCLILGANSAVSDFRDKLLHGCTGPRYKLPRTRRVRVFESISLRGTVRRRPTAGVKSALPTRHLNLTV